MGNSTSQQHNNPIVNKIQDVLNTNTEMFESSSHGLLGGVSNFNKGDKFTTKKGRTGTVIERRTDVSIPAHSGVHYYHVVFDDGQNETLYPDDDMVNTQDLERKRLEEERRRREAEEKRAEEERRRREAEEKRAEEERRRREIDEARKSEEERRRREAAEKRAEEERRRREMEEARKSEEERRRKEAAEKRAEEERQRREMEAARKLEEERKRKEMEEARKLEEERRKKEEEARRKEEEARRKAEQLQKQKEIITSQLNKNVTLIENFEQQIRSTSERIPESSHPDRLRLSDKIKEYENEKEKLETVNKQLKSKLEHLERS
jgi:hypothetical protein